MIVEKDLLEGCYSAIRGMHQWTFRYPVGQRAQVHTEGSERLVETARDQASPHLPGTAEAERLNYGLQRQVLGTGRRLELVHGLVRRQGKGRIMTEGL